MAGATSCVTVPISSMRGHWRSSDRPAICGAWWTTFSSPPASTAQTLAYRTGPTQIGKLVDHAVNHFEGVGLEVRVDCADADVEVDGQRLEQAIHNLVANALRHGKPPVELVERVTGSVYRLAVIDRGEGLDESRIEDPFAPFANAPEDITTANSLGLGLLWPIRLPG